MKWGGVTIRLKLFFVTLSWGLIVGSACASAQARSPNDIGDNISNLIELTLKHDNTQNIACENKARKPDGKCGHSYIYPIVTGHPDKSIGNKINTYVKGLATIETEQGSMVEAWTEVTLNANNILSFSHQTQSYGRHSLANVNSQSCANINLETGEEIPLGMLMHADYASKLPELITSNLDSGLKRKLPQYLRNILAKRNADWVLDSKQAYFLSQHDLTLCFEPGELSTEAIGPLTIALPYSLISTLIDTNGQLSFAINQLEKTAAPTETRSPSPGDNETSSIPPEKTIDSPIVDGNARRIGSVDHICFKDSTTHKISVVEFEPESPFICIVEYDKGYSQSVLWRSRRTKAFCHDSAEKLVTKYRDKWGYTCGHSTSSPDT